MRSVLKAMAGVTLAICFSGGVFASTIEVGGPALTGTFSVDPDLIGGSGNPVTNDVRINFTLGSGSGIAVSLGATTGNATVYESRLRDNSASSFIPASGTFNVGPGGGDFTVDGLTAGNNYQLRLILEANGVPGDGNVSGAYSVAAVPIPAAAWLFVSALVGLITVARRQRANSNDNTLSTVAIA